MHSIYMLHGVLLFIDSLSLYCELRSRDQEIQELRVSTSEEDPLNLVPLSLSLLPVVLTSSTGPTEEDGGWSH